VNFAIVAAVFPIIFVGELPDKTMFASLVMATRGKPRLVWLGAAGAFVVHVVIATTIGVALFHILPRRAVDAVVAVLFFLGAGYAFWESRKGDEVVKLAVKPGEIRPRSTVITAFVVIFVAEWGDLTQILTANLAARYHSPLSVGLGSVLALWAVAALAVAGGQGLLRFVKMSTVRVVTGAFLLILGGFETWSALR
jgi:putative Ca2+/H+ antiporter (TMEM165/GDT1 family)